MDLQDLIASVDAGEQALALTRFDAQDAWWLGSRLRELGMARRAPVAIEIRRAGTTLFLSLLPGATQDNLEWIRRKIALVMRFERSSYAMGLKFRMTEGSFEAFGLDLATYVGAGGAVPLRLAGTGVIGAVAVSGLPQEIDHAMVIEALGDLKAHQAGQG